jgi:hypothetical protein
MRVDSAPLPSPPGLAKPLPAGDPSPVLFEDLLSRSPSPQGEALHRAFGFVELGMFGREAAVEGAAPELAPAGREAASGQRFEPSPGHGDEAVPTGPILPPPPLPDAIRTTSPPREDKEVAPASPGLQTSSADTPSLPAVQPRPTDTASAPPAEEGGSGLPGLPGRQGLPAETGAGPAPPAGPPGNVSSPASVPRDAAMPPPSPSIASATPAMVVGEVPSMAPARAAEVTAIEPAGILRLPTSPPGAEAREPDPPAGGKAARRAAESLAGDQAPIHISLYEEGGATALVAAAPGLSAEDRARLRRLSADLLAEFGLALGHFSLNGAAVEPSLSMSGGAHGDRPD